LNQTLLEQSRKYPGISLFFDHKLTTADFDERTMIFRKGTTADGEEKERTVHFDLCIGADGSYSNVRRQLMRVVR
jgi:kynurenine 3-monooxygenase